MWKLSDTMPSRLPISGVTAIGFVSNDFFCSRYRVRYAKSGAAVSAVFAAAAAGEEFSARAAAERFQPARF
jgi:hypothetical protein